MLERIRRWLSREHREAARRVAAPVDAQALLEPVCAAFQAGRTDEAVRALERIVWAHPQLAEGHRLLGEALRQKGDLAEARDSYTLALHYAPASWETHYGLALVEREEGLLDAAKRELELALAHGGDNVAVHNALGAAHVECGAHAAAEEHFRRALSLDPECAEACSNLGCLLFGQLERYEEGAALVERAAALGSDEPKVRLNRAMVQHLRGNVDGALEIYDALLERDPAFAQARFNRALLRLARGDFERGWPEYEARKETPLFPRAPVAAPDWDGSDLAGRSITIYPEQGIGDEIMFASCVPDLLRSAARVTLVCNPKLERLFRRSFPGATVVNDRDFIPARDTDWTVRIGSLPRFFRRSSVDFPQHAGYLHADPARTRHWKERLAALPGNRKIGIAWRGGLASTHRSLRSIPLQAWGAVLHAGDVDFVSLQHTDCADEIAAVERACDVRIHHWRDALADYDETAALVSALDRVVSVQTAAVHLCGALGVPAWALIPETPEWRYGEAGPTMPWYPSVTLVRKPRGEEWTSVLANIARRLAQPAAGRGEDP